MDGSEPGSATERFASLPGVVAAALDRLADELGSREAVDEVVGLWIEDLVPLLAALECSARTADGAALTATAHRLRSTCALIGAGDLSDQAGALEARGRAGDMAGIGRDVAGFAAAAHAVARALRA